MRNSNVDFLHMNLKLSRRIVVDEPGTLSHGGNSLVGAFLASFMRLVDPTLKRSISRLYSCLEPTSPT